MVLVDRRGWKYNLLLVGLAAAFVTLLCYRWDIRPLDLWRLLVDIAKDAPLQTGVLLLAYLTLVAFNLFLLDHPAHAREWDPHHRVQFLFPMIVSASLLFFFAYKITTTYQELAAEEFTLACALSFSMFLSALAEITSHLKPQGPVAPT